MEISFTVGLIIGYCIAITALKFKNKKPAKDKPMATKKGVKQ